MQQRLARSVGIDEPALGRGTGHELRHPLRARRAQRMRVEPALAPDQPREIGQRQVMQQRGLGDRLADRDGREARGHLGRSRCGRT